MVPESINSDTGEKVACSILRVGNPISETTPAIAGASPVNRSFFFPMISRFTVSHEDLKVVWISNSLLLLRIAAAKKVGLGIKVRETTAVSMVLGRTESFAGHLDFCVQGLGFGSQRFVDGFIKLVPVGVVLPEEFEERFAAFFRETSREKSFESFFNLEIFAVAYFDWWSGFIAD